MLKRKSFRIHKPYGRQCESCGCRLDPGEGRLCEDCQEEKARRERAAQAGTWRRPPAFL